MVKITIEIDEPVMTPEAWEKFEDELRAFLREYFGTEVSGKIESDATGNTTKLDFPICPHCGKPVDRLHNVQTAIITWDFDYRGEYSTLPTEMEATDDLNEWVCPHCGKVVAETEEDALEFLQGD